MAGKGREGKGREGKGREASIRTNLVMEHPFGDGVPLGDCQHYEAVARLVVLSGLVTKKTHREGGWVDG